jgi:hypothetical protein
MDVSPVRVHDLGDAVDPKIPFIISYCRTENRSKLHHPHAAVMTIGGTFATTAGTSG